MESYERQPDETLELAGAMARRSAKINAESAQLYFDIAGEQYTPMDKTIATIHLITSTAINLKRIEDPTGEIEPHALVHEAIPPELSKQLSLMAQENGLMLRAEEVEDFLHNTAGAIVEAALAGLNKPREIINPINGIEIAKKLALEHGVPVVEIFNNPDFYLEYTRAIYTPVSFVEEGEKALQAFSLDTITAIDRNALGITIKAELRALGLSEEEIENEIGTALNEAETNPEFQAINAQIVQRVADVSRLATLIQLREIWGKDAVGQLPTAVKDRLLGPDGEVTMRKAKLVENIQTIAKELALSQSQNEFTAIGLGMEIFFNELSESDSLMAQLDELGITKVDSLPDELSSEQISLAEYRMASWIVNILHNHLEDS